MHKKQAKKNLKNQVGVHKNTPLAIQISQEEYEDFLGEYLQIDSPEEIFEVLDETDSFFSSKIPITEEMLLDCLIDEPDTKKSTSDLESSKMLPKSFYEKLSAIEFEDHESSLFHTKKYNKLFALYKKQREINRRNSEAIKQYISKPLEYFGKVKLLRDVDVLLEGIFNKKKYKKPKKGSKIFDRNIKPVDNSGAEEVLIRREEFKEVFSDLEFPIYEGNLCEENVEADEFLKDKFLRY